MSQNIRRLAAFLAIAFFAASLGAGYWQVIASEALNSDRYNPRLWAEALTRSRGEIVDRDGVVLARSERRGEIYRRIYPNGTLYEPWLGYMTLTFGAAGIEAQYAQSLIGQDPADPLAGLRRRFLGERTPPGSVRLALSSKLQQTAAQALGQRRGAIVALDPKTGEILVAVSNPRYDPNPLTDPDAQRAAFERLEGDSARPFFDRAAQGLYPPGSTFKLVTGAAGLESGAIDPKARVRVDSPWRADPSWGNYAVRSPTNAHGEFDLALAYERSENIYFAMAAIKMGGDRLAEYANRFGLGRDLGLDGPRSRSRLSNTGRLDRPTLVADTAFGQGELLVSPLHLALIAATIGNAGILPTPHYALEVRDASGAVLRRIAPSTLGQPVRADTARLLTELLVGAVEGPGAFAYGARIPNVRVAGKTGTAENPQGPPHGVFVGFAPAGDPRIAIAVVLEHAPRGGEDAAPVAAAVMRAWLGR